MKTEIKFKNGDIYKGEVTDNKFNGPGEYISESGYSLLGNWSNSLPTGSMTIHLKQKNLKIIGTFQNGTLATDKVKIVFSSKDTYEGTIDKDYQLNGQGTYNFYNDQNFQSLTGFFKDNYIEGPCQIQTKSNDKLTCVIQEKMPVDKFSLIGKFIKIEGIFDANPILQGSQSGQVTIEKQPIEYEENEIAYKYEGSFVNQKPDKVSKINFENKIFYEGNFTNGTINGENSVYKTADDILYKGDMVDGEQSGQGVLVYPKDNIEYTGEFHKGFCNGEGVIKHLDTGNVYKGQFLKNTKHGDCEFLLGKDGLKYSGKFEHNCEESKNINFGTRV